MSKALIVEPKDPQTTELVETILMLDLDLEQKVAGLVAAAKARDVVFDQLSERAPKRRGRHPKTLPEASVKLVKNPFDILG